MEYVFPHPVSPIITTGMPLLSLRDSVHFKYWEDFWAEEFAQGYAPRVYGVHLEDIVDCQHKRTKLCKVGLLVFLNICLRDKFSILLPHFPMFYYVSPGVSVDPIAQDLLKFLRLAVAIIFERKHLHDAKSQSSVTPDLMITSYQAPAANHIRLTDSLFFLLISDYPKGFGGSLSPSTL